MRCSTIATLDPATPSPSLPLRIRQKPAAASQILKLSVVLPATIALLTPFLILGIAAAADPAVRATLEQRPGAAIQLALALAFWLVLFAWPLKRLTEGLARSRHIEIDRTSVRVTENTLFGPETWSQSLSAYRGIAHHVRASLSGTRHELILVHENPERSLLLSIADRIPQSEIERVCTLLGHNEIPARELYRLQIVPARLGRTLTRPTTAAA
jgi:hypothetical protein